MWLVFAASLAACADDSIQTIYDPCSPLTISLAADVNDDERAGVAQAIAAWADVVSARITIGSGPQSPDVLPIEFSHGDTFYRGIYWDALGYIAIGRDRLVPEDYGIAIAHEMGHAFGLQHVERADRTSVMNVSNLETPPLPADAALVKANWEACRTE